MHDQRKNEEKARVIGFVEDDDVIRENYSDVLERAGFRVRSFRDRASAIHSFSGGLPDLAVLDVALGVERDGGFRLCQELRQLSDEIPIIFLTSHDTEIDKISGLRLGADDYLSKESSLDLLVVRIETLLRRYEFFRRSARGTEPKGRSELVQGELRIDRERSVVEWKGEGVDLPLTQLWMVEALAQDPGRALNHEELMRAANVVVEPNTIAAHIKSIRQRFRIVDTGFDAIRTERGLGYRWIVE